MWVGTALIFLASLLRRHCFRMLGQYFTGNVQTVTGQAVIDRGAYRYVRHPSYTGGLITILGILVCLTNPVAFLGLIPPLAGYAYRIHIEEKALARSLGDPYRSYMRRTKRLIPFLV